MLETQETYSLSDFLRDHEAHVARLKETRRPEVLTVNGRAEIVVLNAEFYQDLVETIQREKEIREVRASMAREKADGRHQEEVSQAEIERSEAVMRELVEETERLGLYR